MVDITISSEFYVKWPGIKLACIECELEPVEHHTELWTAIKDICKQLRSEIKIDDVGKIPAIQSSRKAYKACGKDPARYRLSAEALMRRVIKGNNLYQINNVVDIVNLASVKTGFSIGGYDVDQIEGAVNLGVGRTNEPYEGIGRGELNIDGLPVLRDNISAFGSPTSDSLRTSVTLNTKHFLMVFFGFGAHNLLDEALIFSEGLLIKFANASNINRYYIH